MKKIMNNTNDFGIVWNELDEVNNRLYGCIQIIIGSQKYPKDINKGYYTLQTVFSNMKLSFLDKYYPGGTTGNDFSEKEFSADKWGKLEIKDVFLIETTEMNGDINNGLCLCLGYSSNEERLFYSFDNEKTFHEIRYPKGTVESIISKLPHTQDSARL